MDRICRAQIAECSLKLPHVLRLGSTEITTRDYVVLRLECESGVYGEAIGYSRGTPLLEVLAGGARLLLGRDATMRRQLTEFLTNRNAPGQAGLTRGLSLLDIALWDIACKVAGQPLYQYIGGLKPEAKVTAVAGYYMDLRSISEIADEVSGMIDGGYERVKIMLNGNDLKFDIEYASTICDRAPGRVAADAHWSFTTLTEAHRLCSALDDFGLAFIEDPFTAKDIRYTHELQGLLKTPIAAGEDVFGAATFLDLVSGIGLLRVDATTCGGITGALQAISIAAAAGRTVFPHVFAPLHIHLACALPNVEAAEFIPEASGADPLHLLLSNCPEVHNGAMKPGQEPGVGIHVNWKNIEQFAKRTQVISAER